VNRVRIEYDHTALYGRVKRPARAWLDGIEVTHLLDFDAKRTIDYPPGQAEVTLNFVADVELVPFDE